VHYTSCATAALIMNSPFGRHSLCLAGGHTFAHGNDKTNFHEHLQFLYRKLYRMYDSLRAVPDRLYWKQSIWVCRIVQGVCRYMRFDSANECTQFHLRSGH
jgi:hypothetical protein